MTKFAAYFQCYENHLLTPIVEYERDPIKLVFPLMPPAMVESICDQVARLFLSEQMVLRLEGDFIIVGDLHGHYLDLVRILQTCGKPPATKYLFLGDIVDRGEFSTETLTFIYLLKLNYPEHVYIIRGNHEFESVCQRDGFMSEIFQIYGSTSLQANWLHSFVYMPLAAVVNENIFCVHGGIGPTLKTIRDIEILPRPLFEFNAEPISSILWSDPSTQCALFRDSNRGIGFFFGQRALEEFLEQNKMSILIRGHECVSDGVQQMFDGKLLTVFSASSYAFPNNNSAGILIVQSSGEKQVLTFPPMVNITRKTVRFIMRDLNKKLELLPEIPRAPVVGSSTSRAAPSKLPQLPKIHAPISNTSRQPLAQSRRAPQTPLASKMKRTETYRGSATRKKLYS